VCSHHPPNLGYFHHCYSSASFQNTQHSCSSAEVGLLYH
jgi:hypothetical protein